MNSTDEARLNTGGLPFSHYGFDDDTYQTLVAWNGQVWKMIILQSVPMEKSQRLKAPTISSRVSGKQGDQGALSGLMERHSREVRPCFQISVRKGKFSRPIHCLTTDSAVECTRIYQIVLRGGISGKSLSDNIPCSTGTARSNSMRLAFDPQRRDLREGVF